MTEIIKKAIKDWAEDDRPREKLIQKGKTSLSNAELLAILIGSGNGDESAVGLSQRILSSAGDSISELSKYSVEQLTRQFKGIGEAKAVSIIAALELGHRRMLSQMVEKVSIRCSKDLHNAIYENLMDIVFEEFWVIFLNTKLKIIKKTCICTGGLTESIADVRKIFKLALECNANSIAVAHNHPSGDIAPSHNDKLVTKKIKECGELLNIKLIDHIIVGDDNHYYSFADNGEF